MLSLSHHHRNISTQFFCAKYGCTVPESSHLEGYLNVIPIRAIKRKSIFLKIHFRQRLKTAPHSKARFRLPIQFIESLLQAVVDFHMPFNIIPLKVIKTPPYGRYIVGCLKNPTYKGMKLWILSNLLIFQSIHKNSWHLNTWGISRGFEF